MIKEYTDQELVVIEIIKRLQSGDGTDEQIDKWVHGELAAYPEVFDLIFYPDSKLSAEEILKRAKKSGVIKL